MHGSADGRRGRRRARHDPGAERALKLQRPSSTPITRRHRVRDASRLTPDAAMSGENCTSPGEGQRKSNSPYPRSSAARRGSWAEGPIGRQRAGQDAMQTEWNQANAVLPVKGPCRGGARGEPRCGVAGRGAGRHQHDKDQSQHGRPQRHRVTRRKEPGQGDQGDRRIRRERRAHSEWRGARCAAGAAPPASHRLAPRRASRVRRRSVDDHRHGCGGDSVDHHLQRRRTGLQALRHVDLRRHRGR